MSNAGLKAGLAVPFSRPHIGEEEIDAVSRVLRSGWLTTGPEVERFEHEFRTYTGADAAVAVNSCTAGLHLALTALNIGPGDEVITTPLTFCATVQAIEETGATVVLCDIGHDLNLDVTLLPRVLTSRTRAILPVHVAGLPCDLDAIHAFAREHGLFVIEDAAHAAGAEYRQTRIGGGQSEATVFSFYANKNMTTGEGGMVTTPDPALAARMRLLSVHGVSRTGASAREELPWYYEVIERGLKCNMSDIQAAIGRVQLRKLESAVKRRAAIAQHYLDRFAGHPAMEPPPTAAGTGHAWHLFILRLNLGALAMNRDEFTRELARRGVGSSVHFIPIPLHPYYRERFHDPAFCHKTLREFPRLVSLPLYPAMTDRQVELVVDAVLDILQVRVAKAS